MKDPKSTPDVPEERDPCDGCNKPICFGCPYCED